MSASEQPENPRVPAQRTIVRAEALAYLSEHPAPPHASIVTSLPDVSELPELGLARWQAWFTDAARQLLRWLPPEGVAIFYQSDIRAAGTWIDKGYLVMRAAEEERAQLVWHKIVCRKPAGSVQHGRSSYSHMLCISRSERPAMKHGSPDVLADAGLMPWSKAMGVSACLLACRYLQNETDTRLVVDPSAHH